MSGHSRHLPAGGLLAALALLMLARPYEGVQHDGMLYFGQVLQRSRVPGLGGDPFFAGGSQDQFSLYSSLLDPLYSWFGPALTHQGLLLTSLLISACLVSRLLGRWTSAPAWGLLALAVMSPIYGGLHKFSITENFLTARSLAEPLLLASLVALARDRLAHAAAWQLAAALLHPLMALPGLAATWILALQRDWRWLWLLALPLAGVALGLAGVAPMTRLVAVYDPFWWSQVSGSNKQVVLSNWTWADALTVLTDTALLATAARSAWVPDDGRRLLIAITLCTIALLGVHAIGTDLLHSVLLTQLQPWRVLWLTHLLSTVLAPYLLWRAWQRRGLWRLSAALLALTLMNNHAGGAYGAPLLAGWIATSACAWRGMQISNRATWLGIASCSLLLLTMAGLRLSLELERLYWHPPVSPTLGIASHIITTPMLAFTLAGIAAIGWPQRKAWRTAGAALGLLSLTAAILCWDRRDELNRAIEAVPSPAPFEDQMPADATVFWPEQLAGTWGLLQHASHYNRQQGAGLLFNRATAELMAPRRAAYQGINDDFEQCEIGSVFGRSPAQLAACAVPSVTRLRTLCAGALHPDYIVVQHPLPIAPLATWTTGRVTLRLHDCSQFGAPSSPGR